MDQKELLTREERIYYEKAKQESKGLLAMLQTLEGSILRQMQSEGYGENQLKGAIFNSRYDLAGGGKEGERAYFQSIFPEGAGSDDFSLPVSSARFNELFEAGIETVKDASFSADKKILSEMQEKMPLDDVREAYLGNSLYRRLCGNDNTARPAEQSLWKSYRKERAEASKSEMEKTEEDFLRIWNERSKADSMPLSYREGAAAREYLRETGADEETLALLLEKYTEYQGRDKIAYLRKLARDAYKEKCAYDALTDADENNNFARALRSLVKGRDGRPFLFSDEQRLAAVCLANGVSSGALSSMIAASPTLLAAGIDHDKARRALLGGKGEMPFLEGAYVTFEDTYRRILVDAEEALIREGRGRSVTEDRMRYNRLAVKELLKEGATEEELKDILLRIGGLPARAGAQESVEKMLKDAREEKDAKAVGESDEPTEDAEDKGIARNAWMPVREEAEPSKEETREAAEPVRAAARMTARARRAERGRIGVFALQTKREEDMEADQFYDMCASEFNQSFSLPFNDAMDEQIILHMLNQGYEEREIVSAVERLSDAPSNHRQTNYAQNKLKNMKKNPQLKAKMEGFAQKLVNAERNYLQTKYREGKTMTSHDEALVRKRDPVGVPQ